jgi:hypothetical protein
VLCDDLGWGDPRCSEPASHIPTPRIDAFAAAEPAIVCSLSTLLRRYRDKGRSSAR